MPMKSIDFSKDLGVGGNPVAPSGELLISAATTEAKGKAVAQGVNDNLLTEGVKAGLDAAHGYLESGVEKDIKSTVGKLDTANKFGDAVMKYDVLASNADTSPADLKEAQDQMQKYKMALDQGVMTREQALLAIDKSVKDYSNVLPGYASKLRALATTLTGVEHMGNYAEYAILTKKTEGEKQREQALKDQNALVQKAFMDFTEKYKRPPIGGINGPDMRIFQAEAAIAYKAEQLKAQASIRDATVAQNEPVVTEFIQTRMAGAILTLNSRLQGITTAADPKTGRMQTPENKILLRQQILSDIGTTFEGIKADLLGFNANQISNATRETTLTRLNTQQKELTDALKNQDAFDDFKKTMEIQSLQAKNVWDKFVIAHPHAKIMKESGMVTPDTVKLWIDSQQDPRRSAEFRKLYGDRLDDYYRSMSGNGASRSYTDNAAKVGSDPDHLTKLRDTDPGQYSAQLQTLVGSIRTVAEQGWGQSEEMQKVRKQNFGTWLHSFANQIDPNRPDVVREWTKLVSDPNVAKRIKELPLPEQLKAVEPVYTKTRELLEDPQFGLFKRLSQLQDSNRGLGDRATSNFEVILNPITQQFQIATPRKRSKEMTDVTPQGAAGLRFVPGGYSVSDGGSRQAGEVKQIVETINRSLASLNNFKDIKGILPPDMAEKGVTGEYFNLFANGFFKMSPEEQVDYLGTTPFRADPSAETPDWSQISGDNKAGLDGAVKIRMGEVQNDPAKIEAAYIEAEKAVADLKKNKDAKGEVRGIVKRELEIWKRAKELIQKEQPWGVNKRSTDKTGTLSGIKGGIPKGRDPFAPNRTPPTTVGGARG